MDEFEPHNTLEHRSWWSHDSGPIRSIRDFNKTQKIPTTLYW